MQKFTELQRQKLLKEFTSLKGISAKFQFWKSKLKTEYITFLFLESPYYQRTIPESEIAFSLRDFTILPNEKELEEYHKTILKQYTNHVKKSGEKSKLLDLQQLVEDFNSDLQNSSSADILIKYELGKIESRIAGSRNRANPHSEDKRWFLHCVGYENELLRSEEPDLSSTILDYRELISLLNGSILAKYNKHLVSLLESLKSEEHSKRKEKISLHQQILLLHFLGIFEKINQHPVASRKAEFLSQLLNKAGQNIRKLLSKEIYTLLTPEARKKRHGIEEDLRTVYELLASIGLGEEAKQVKKELDSVL